MIVSSVPARTNSAGVDEERLVVLDLDGLREIVAGLADVDVGAVGLAEDAEDAAEAEVDARRLDGVGVQRLDDEPSRRQLLPDRPIAEHHRRPSSAAHSSTGRKGRQKQLLPCLRVRGNYRVGTGDVALLSQRQMRRDIQEGQNGTS